VRVIEHPCYLAPPPTSPRPYGALARGALRRVAEYVVYAVLLEEEVDDVRAPEGGGEVQGRGARAGRVGAVGRDGAVREEKGDCFDWGKRSCWCDTDEDWIIRVVIGIWDKTKMVHTKQRKRERTE
jgi:hypothetical protein